jgi:hypothetical protein
MAMVIFVMMGIIALYIGKDMLEIIASLRNYD